MHTPTYLYTALLECLYTLCSEDQPKRRRLSYSLAFVLFSLSDILFYAELTAVMTYPVIILVLQKIVVFFILKDTVNSALS